MTWKEAYPDIPLGRTLVASSPWRRRAASLPPHRAAHPGKPLPDGPPSRGHSRRGDGTGIQTDIPRELWAHFLERVGLDPNLAFNPRFFVGHFFVPKSEEGR